MFNLRKFKAQMILKGETVSTLSEKMGMDESTFYRKLRADGAFTREEMSQLIEILDINDPMNIFFASGFAETQNEGE